ncbi:hypothetical protein BD779DRAFT_1524310 [Infundibulicybe gibba]|nr:hypothetical protein BD779DRAFT_1524310 [Infundibulicybe gibba]
MTDTTQIAITFAQGSPYLKNPVALNSIHPSITYIGQVGELVDVQLVSVPKSQSEDIAGRLRQAEGAVRVDIQVPKSRSKRRSDEL